MSTLKSKKQSEKMGTGNLTKTGPRVSCFFYPMVGWCTAHASFPFISKLQLYLSSFAVTLVQEKPQQKKINIARLQNCPGNTIGLEKSSHCYNFQPGPEHCYYKVQHCEYCPVSLLIVRSKWFRFSTIWNVKNLTQNTYHVVSLSLSCVCVVIVIVSKCLFGW